MCARVSLNGCICNLRAGHLTPHHAHGLNKCLETWEPITNREFMEKNPCFGALDNQLQIFKRDFLKMQLSDLQKKAVNYLTNVLYDPDKYKEGDVTACLYDLGLRPTYMLHVAALKTVMMVIGQIRFMNEKAKKEKQGVK